MKTPEFLVRNFNVGTRPTRRVAVCALLGISALFVFAGCAYDGTPVRSSGYPGPYRSGGYYMGGVHRGHSYGIQHGFPRSGFGPGGFGRGGRRH